MALRSPPDSRDYIYDSPQNPLAPIASEVNSPPRIAGYVQMFWRFIQIRLSSNK